MASRLRGRVAALLAIATTSAITVVVLPTTSFAEGSRDLFTGSSACAGNGECRANIEWRTGSYGPSGSSIYRRTLFTVFLKSGERLLTGSSAVGVGAGDVVVWNPDRITDQQAATLPSVTTGTNGFKCSDQRTASGSSTAGRITSRAQETAGPQSVSGGGNPTGYVPCSYVAPTTGLYQVAFYGPTGASANTETAPTGEVGLGSASNFSSAQGTSVAAWDVTVRDSDTSTTDLAGRLFTYALAAFTGDNAKPVYSTLYATTLDGFVYRVGTNGLDPNGFLVYGNERGFLDPEGRPLDHDVLGSNSTISTLQGGTTLAAPQYPISFSPLSSDTLHALSVPTEPTTPVLSNLAFEGAPTGQSVYLGHGGTFTFDLNEHGTYSIVISRTGTNFDPGLPTNRVLRAVADAGSQSVVWDGKDNAGNNLPVGTGYAVHAEERAGVYHFPLVDAENSTRGGPSFTLTNPPAGVCPFGNTSCTTAFYDDRGYHTSYGGGTNVGTPGSVLCGQNPPSTAFSNPVTGYVSTGTQRAWGASPGVNSGASCTGSFGDAKGLDSWSYFPSSTRSASLNVLAVPAAPTAGDDTGSTPVGTTRTVSAAQGVLGNDTGDSLQVSAHSEPSHGTLTISADGSYVYVPTTGYSGPDSFTYTARDPAGQTATATVRLTVTPRATDDTGSTPADTTRTVAASSGVLANDHGSALSVTGHTEPSHGSLTLSADGSYVYVPQAGYSGLDSFDYTATDAAGASSNATVRLTVTPRAVDDAGETPVDTELSLAPVDGVLGNDHGSSLSVTGHTAPAHGTLTLGAAGGYAYLPAPGYSGPDSFTYTVTDSAAQTSTATVRLRVTPLANPDAQSTRVNRTLVVAASAGVLANDRGVGLTVTAHTGPAHGTLTLDPDGRYAYTPEADYSGPDTFDYTLTDGDGQHSTATVTLTVTPQAPDDTGSTPANTTLHRSAGTGVLANDHGSGLEVTDHTAPAHGDVTVLGDGSFGYEPDEDYSGTDSFTYTATDDAGGTATATVRLTVTPTAGDDAGTTPAGTALSVTPEDGLLGDDHGTLLAVTAHTSPDHGTVEVAADGSYTYTPQDGYSGPDGFGYTLTDHAGQTTTATVRLTVTPRAVDDTGTTPLGSPLVRDAAHGVLANDLGTGLTVTGHAQPGHGTVDVGSDGSFTYTPLDGYSGPDAFTYTVLDDHDQSTTATVRLTVGLAAVDDSGETRAGTPLVVPVPGVLANDSGTSLLVTSFTQPGHGSVTVAGDGSYTYVASDRWSGPDSFTYQVRDAAGQTATATVRLSVTPQARADVGSLAAGTTLDVPAGLGVLGNDLGHGLEVVDHTAAAHGVVTIGTDGSFRYVPDRGFSGQDSFTYTAQDAAGQRVTTTVSLSVLPPAVPDTTSTPAEQPVTIDPTANDPDHAGFVLTTLRLRDPVSGAFVLQVTVEGEGTWVVDPDAGTVTFTPVAGFTGTTRALTYRVLDADGLAHTSTMTVTVAGETRPTSTPTPTPTPTPVPRPGVTGVEVRPSAASTGTTTATRELAATGNPVGPGLPLVAVAMLAAGVALLRRRNRSGE